MSIGGDAGGRDDRSAEEVIPLSDGLSGVAVSEGTELLERGVTGYSFDQCFDDYRRSAMFCLVYPVVAGGNLDLANERGAELVTALLDRSVATILDLDCDETIPA